MTAAPTKRERKPAARLSSPDSAAGKLQRAALAVLQQHEQEDGGLPTFVRFVFYELTQAGALAKRYDHKRRTPSTELSEAITVLRESGTIPWWWIKDETRDVERYYFHDSVAESVLDAATQARLDTWAGAPAPLIITESRNVKAALSDLAYEYLVPVTATGGQCAGHLVTEVAPLIDGNDRRVLYIGDFEVGGPGDQIEANTRWYLERYTGRTFGPHDWERIALTRTQVDADPRLLDLVIVKKDGRFKGDGGVYEAVECEAVGQSALIRLVRERLDQLLPKPLAAVRAREQAERDRMAAILATLR